MASSLGDAHPFGLGSDANGSNGQKTSQKPAFWLHFFWWWNIHWIGHPDLKTGKTHGFLLIASYLIHYSQDLRLDKEDTVTYCTQQTYGVSPNFPMVSKKSPMFYQDFLDTTQFFSTWKSGSGSNEGSPDLQSQVGSVGISKSNGLVMKVSAVDYLAATTVICTDKTGTLTEALVGHGGWWAMVGGGPRVDGFMVKMLGEWVFWELITTVLRLSEFITWLAVWI